MFHALNQFLSEGVTRDALDRSGGQRLGLGLGLGLGSGLGFLGLGKVHLHFMVMDFFRSKLVLS